MKWHAEVVYASGAVDHLYCPDRHTARAFIAGAVADWDAVQSVAVRKVGRRCGWKQVRR